MPINACSINKNSINAVCGIYSILYASVVEYDVVIPRGTEIDTTPIGTFSGGPITGISVSLGSLNGPGGTLVFSADPGPFGNIYFSGRATTHPGVYTGQIRLLGQINSVTINFSIGIIEAETVEKGYPQHIGSLIRLPPGSIDRYRDEDDFDINSIEQPVISVSVEFMGTRSAQSLERNAVADSVMVTISNFKAAASDPEVNISDVKISRIAASDPEVNISDVKISRIKQ